MRGQSFVYELLFDGPAASEAPHLSGLIDVATMGSSRGSALKFAGSTRGDHGPNAVGSRASEMRATPDNQATPDDPLDEAPTTRLLKRNGHDASYVPAPLA